MDCEEFEKLGFKRNLGISGVSVDTVEKVGLLIVIRGEDNIVDDSLQYL